MDSPNSTGNLAVCPDCSGYVSKQAAMCPKCGRMFKALQIDRTGWVLTVAGGIVLGYFLIGILIACFWIVIFVLLAGSLAGSQR